MNDFSTGLLHGRNRPDFGEREQVRLRMSRMNRLNHFPSRLIRLYLYRISNEDAFGAVHRLIRPI